MIDRLSERAPSIVVFTLCAALLAGWIDAPVWLPEAAAAVVGFLAILLFAARGGRGRFKDREDEAEASGKSWLDYELAGKGTPPGYYVLAFFGIVTIALTGFRSHVEQSAGGDTVDAFFVFLDLLKGYAK